MQAGPPHGSAAERARGTRLQFHAVSQARYCGHSACDRGGKGVRGKGVRPLFRQTPFSSLAADSPQAWVESLSYRADCWCIPWLSRARYCDHFLGDRGASYTSRRGLGAGGVRGTGELRTTNLELRTKTAERDETCSAKRTQRR